MYIKEISIDSFGCLSKKTIVLSDGFNLIYGPNESGKSTLFAFIVFIFYGTKVKKLSGDLSFRDRYMPWNGNPMHGKIIFEHSNKTYVASRMYSDTQSTFTLYCMDTGENIKDRDILKSPGEYFFGVSSESFYRSTYICALQTKYNSMSAGELISKLTNTYENTSTEVSYDAITDIINNEISNLSSEKRKNAVIPNLKTKISDLRQNLSKTQDYKSEIERLISEKESLDNKILRFENELKLLKDCASDVPSTKENRFSFQLLLSFVFLIVSVVLLYLLPSPITLCMAIIVLILLCVFGVCQIVSIKKRQSLDARKLFTMQANNDKMVLLGEEILKAKERKIKIEERYDILSKNLYDVEALKRDLTFLENELNENQKRLEALKLSKIALSNAFYEFKSIFSPKLSNLTAEFLSLLTEGKYNSAVVDEALDVSIDSGYEFKSALSFSQGTMEQAYFAMRIALGKIVLSKENAPLFLDDALAFYDEHRLKTALEFLLIISEKTQVIFSTCRNTEQLILKDKEIKVFNF